MLCPKTVVQQVQLRVSNDEPHRVFCLSWLKATYEPCAGKSIEQNIMYKQYLASMHRMGRKEVISAQHYALCIRTLFGGSTGPNKKQVGDKLENHYTGIQVREQPLPLKLTPAQAQAAQEASRQQSQQPQQTAAQQQPQQNGVVQQQPQQLQQKIVAAPAGQQIIVNAAGQQLQLQQGKVLVSAGGAQQLQVAGGQQVIQVNPATGGLVTSGGQLIVNQAGQVVQQRIVNSQGAIVAQGMVQGQVISSGFQNKNSVTVQQQPQQQIPLGQVIQRIVHPGGRVEEKVVGSTQGLQSQVILQQQPQQGQVTIQPQQQQQQVVVSSGGPVQVISGGQVIAASNTGSSSAPAQVISGGQTQVVRTASVPQQQVSAAPAPHADFAQPKSPILQDLLKSKSEQKEIGTLVGYFCTFLFLSFSNHSIPLTFLRNCPKNWFS